MKSVARSMPLESQHFSSSWIQMSCYYFHAVTASFYGKPTYSVFNSISCSQLCTRWRGLVVMVIHKMVWYHHHSCIGAFIAILRGQTFMWLFATTWILARSYRMLTDLEACCNNLVVRFRAR